MKAHKICGAAGLAFGLAGLLVTILCRCGASADELKPVEPTPEPVVAVVKVEMPDSPMTLAVAETVTTTTLQFRSPDLPEMYCPPIDYSADQVIAQLVWGEGRGLSKTEQAAIVWCVCNRVDSDDPFFPDDLISVATQRSQFHGYDPGNPVDDDILALVRDVLTRWSVEEFCTGGVGRVLPREWCFFYGDGQHNYYQTEYRGSQLWDWSLPSPYEEVAK